LRGGAAFGMLSPSLLRAYTGENMQKYISVFVAVVALLLAAPLRADDADAGKAQKFIDGLHFQTGTVNVPAANATLTLTPEFRYLDAKDAQKVLSQLWGNPPDSDVLGMLVPTAAPLSDPKNSWAVVITYKDDGHVADDEAAKIDYDKMLKDMQEGTHEANPERKKQGYPEIELIGWAAKPHYDATTNKIYWAKELAVSGAREHTLNYDIRALGRGGYLSLNAVAGMDQLGMVQTEMQKVVGMTTFDSGKRYGDFNASTDKVAAYGIGALVAGAIAAKAGLFAKLLVLLIAAKKFIIVGFLAVAAGVKKFFGRKSQ
jgi:uncharacterized membrane-anchored protein